MTTILQFCPKCYHESVELDILGFERCTNCGYIHPIKFEYGNIEKKDSSQND